MADRGHAVAQTEDIDALTGQITALL